MLAKSLWDLFSHSFVPNVIPQTRRRIFLEKSGGWIQCTEFMNNAPCNLSTIGSLRCENDRKKDVQQTSLMYVPSFYYVSCRWHIPISFPAQCWCTFYDLDASWYSLPARAARHSLPVFQFQSVIDRWFWSSLVGSVGSRYVVLLLSGWQFYKSRTNEKCSRLQIF